MNAIKRAHSLALIVTAAGVLHSPSAMARTPLRCNTEQSMCVIDKRDTHIGDDIVFINRYDQIVARGTVEKVNGSERTIKIERKNGTILRSDRFALVDLNNRLDPVLRMKEYRKPEDKSIEANLGIGTIRSDEGIPAYVFGATYDWRTSYKFFLTGSADMIIAKGMASREDPGLGVEQQPVSLYGLGVLPGIAMRFFEHTDVQPRIEGGVGFMYVSGSVGGDASQFDGAGYETGMNNGIGMYSKIKGSVLYRMSDWSAEAGGTMMALHHTVAYSVMLGAVKPLN